jgi:hypothetical protein
MTMKKFVQGSIVTVALCLITTAGCAQNNTFFLMGGVSSLFDKRSFTEGNTPYNSTFATGGKVIVGIEVPLKKSKIFSFEGSYGIGLDNLELTYFNTSPVSERGYDMRNQRLSGDLVVHPPRGCRGARPYLVLGPEYDRFSPTGAATSLGTTAGFAYAAVAKLAPQNSAGVNFGGGIDYRMSSNVGVRIDVRDHITNSPTLGLPYAPTATSAAFFPVSGYAHNIEYCIGIVYNFEK